MTDETVTRTVPLLPLPGGVIAPQMVVNLVVDSHQAVRAFDAARTSDGELLVVPHIGDRYAKVGTLARVEQDERRGDGRRSALIRGLRRALVGPVRHTDGDLLWVEAARAGETVGDPERVDRLAREYRATIGEILRHRRAGGVAAAIAEITDPGALADTAIYSPDLDDDQKLDILETVDVAERLELVLQLAHDILAELQVREEVTRRAGEQLEQSQREAILRQQLAAIRSELGEDAGAEAADGYRTRIAEAHLPRPVREKAEKELDRLERMSEQNPEHGWVRTWLDTILELPWGTRTDDTLDLAAARDVLDADHTGLDDVKERIIEFLAVRKLRAERGLDPVGPADDAAGRRGGGAILALVGPPGVGKTSLGASVARALGRRFVRVALGGIRDEAEIRGHRRTYVGARPGRIARALADAGSLNPVFLLDEVDKVAADWRGDPTAALLEVLDPAQNHTFRDHYLEVDLDLSDVVFIATGNILETIPEPLLDRMEVIRVDGYTDEEKVAIARAHLLPRQTEQAGLGTSELEVPDEVLAAVVSGWTRESGVRSLERQVGKLTRKVATRVATGEVQPPVTVAQADLRALLGRAPVHHERAEDRVAVPGVATGLAVTGMGGDVLFIEASLSDGEPGLTLTGQLGEVMRESASIALSYVRSHAADLGLREGALDGKRVHLHVPAGAVPKDGPSAGITMVTALVSLLTGRTVAADVGMTGEVTLSGRVLPIGGVKQKLLAAHRFGLGRVLLPARNADDLDDVPAAVREALDIRLVATVDEVLAAAFTEQGADSEVRLLA